MIDSVRLKFDVQPTDDHFRAGWEQKGTTYLASGDIESFFVYNPDKIYRIPLKATYRPIDWQGNPLFWIELSLPRVLYGYNWPMIPDIPTAIAALDALFHDCPALPYIPTAADGQLMRIDACYNYFVGDALPHYLRALNTLEYPRRQTVPFMGTGVEYRSVSSKTKYYDKFQEAKHHRLPREVSPPPGTLRHESNYNKTDTTAAALRAPKPVRLGDLAREPVLDILRRDMQHLGIFNCRFATRDSSLRQLGLYYKPAKVMKIYGALCANQERDKQTIAHEADLSRHTVNRYFREAAQAGLARALADIEDLPPLEIAWPPDPRFTPPGRLIPHKRAESVVDLIAKHNETQSQQNHSKLYPSPGDTLGTWPAQAHERGDHREDD